MESGAQPDGGAEAPAELGGPSPDAASPAADAEPKLAGCRRFGWRGARPMNTFQRPFKRGFALASYLAFVGAGGRDAHADERAGGGGPDAPPSAAPGSAPAPAPERCDSVWAPFRAEFLEFARAARAERVLQASKNHQVDCGVHHRRMGLMDQETEYLLRRASAHQTQGVSSSRTTQPLLLQSRRMAARVAASTASTCSPLLGRKGRLPVPSPADGVPFPALPGQGRPGSCLHSNGR